MVEVLVWLPPTKLHTEGPGHPAWPAGRTCWFPGISHRFPWTKVIEVRAMDTSSLSSLVFPLPVFSFVRSIAFQVSSRQAKVCVCA